MGIEDLDASTALVPASVDVFVVKTKFFMYVCICDWKIYMHGTKGKK
jgi:hypothetical protein